MEPFHLGSDHFYKIIKIKHARVSWEKVHQEIPYFPKGWFELAQLSPEDRIEFLFSFWMGLLQEGAPEALYQIQCFFSELHDVSIIATQFTRHSPFEIHMIYELRDGRFFHAAPGATLEELAILQSLFPQIEFPQDYFGFLRIHNGFSQFLDVGVISTFSLAKMYALFQASCAKPWWVIGNNVYSKDHFIPFYGGYGLDDFQCFIASMQDTSINNVSMCVADLLPPDYLFRSFSSFLHWFAYYIASSLSL